MKNLPFILLLSCFLGLYGRLFAQAASVHSHNDYMRNIPFWEAAAAQCASIEADVIMVGDTLFVAHEKASIRAGRTLEALYLEPIKLAVNLKFSLPANLQLLVDCKTDAAQTLPALIRSCEKYRDYLSGGTKGTTIRIVVSGNRPNPRDYDQSPAYLFFDHQSLDDLDQISLKKVALVSVSFTSNFHWNGKRDLDESEKERIHQMADQVHRHQLPFRFWGTPDTPLAWQVLPGLGIDFINTDTPNLVRCTR